MATPIQNNTEALQRILQAVNDLPEESPGVTVQTKSGTFTASSSIVTVDCGFKPDVVMIDRGEAGADIYHFAAAAPFFRYSQGTKVNITIWTLVDYELYDIIAVQTNTGFTIVADGLDSGWYYETANTTFNYYAVKFT